VTFFGLYSNTAVTDAATHPSVPLYPKGIKRSKVKSIRNIYSASILVQQWIEGNFLEDDYVFTCYFGNL
jgi:hypothetical protein